MAVISAAVSRVRYNHSGISECKYRRKLTVYGGGRGEVGIDCGKGEGVKRGVWDKAEAEKKIKNEEVVSWKKKKG